MIYVRADCGNGDLSDWSSKANFTTECAIINAPFFDDVEIHNATTTFNESECWYTVQTSYGWDISDDDTPSSDTGPNQAYSGTNFFFTEGSSGSAGDVAELYSPTIDVSSLTAPALMFYYHMFNGDTPGDMGELHVDVYAGNSWNNDVMPPLVGTQQTAQADPWIEKKL
ncbi:hypothetical protein ACFSO9_01795 [Mesonia maritima]|uniref:hypothetical protein n=1 Tax=Mesonia maritima TaxID=1793873 RepID=UPI003638B5A1